MQFFTFTSALFIAMAAATPLANEDLDLVKRDLTPEGLWKRDCDGTRVQNPECNYGTYKCFHANGSAQCVVCGLPCQA
ncbi:hypothetical protein F4818DRAFT_306015 [Hypoxylon cercidicola]|nr:hypothetical protein F4818DRAFT_306015 [Hypoxylon cercidicola]